MGVVEATSRPKSLTALRIHHLQEAFEAVIFFSAGAFVFWAIGFGTDASPSVPRLLITVSVPVLLLKEYLVYAAAVKRLGLIDVPKTSMAGVSTQSE